MNVGVILVRTEKKHWWSKKRELTFRVAELGEDEWYTPLPTFCNPEPEPELGPGPVLRWLSGDMGEEEAIQLACTLS